MLRQLLAKEEDDAQPSAHANVTETLTMRGPMLVLKVATLRHLACAPRRRIAQLQGRIPALLSLAQRAMTVDILRKRQIMVATAGTPTRARIVVATARRTVPATAGIALTATAARAAATAHIATTARTATIAPTAATAHAAAVVRTAGTAQVAASCPHHQSLIAIVNCAAVTHVQMLPSTRSHEILIHHWSIPCVNQQQCLEHPNQPAAAPGTRGALKGTRNALPRTGKAQLPMVPRSRRRMCRK